MPYEKEKNGYLSGSFVMLVGAVVLLSRVSCARRREDNGSRGSFRRYGDAGADFYRQLGGPRNRSNPSLPKCAIGSLDRKIIGGKRFSDASFDLHDTLEEVKKNERDKSLSGAGFKTENVFSALFCFALDF